MSKEGCIRNLMENGFTYKEASERCGEYYESKTTPGVQYESIVPGAKTTPGRVAYEKQLRWQKVKKRQREYYRGVPRG